MKIQVTFDLTPEQINELWSQAARYGFKREEPRKSWSQREIKESARWVIQKIIEKEAQR